MKRLKKLGDDAGDVLSEYFNCIMLFFLGVLILGVPLLIVCFIFGTSLVAILGKIILGN
jgi:hypothetical protein